MLLTVVQCYFYYIQLTRGWVKYLKTQCLEVKWEVEDHIMMRFNHKLFHFYIGFPCI